MSFLETFKTQTFPSSVFKVNQRPHWNVAHWPCHHPEHKKKEKGNGHEKIDEIGYHQKAYGAGMKTSIGSREFNRSKDEINFNF